VDTRGKRALAATVATLLAGAEGWAVHQALCAIPALALEAMLAELEAAHAMSHSALSAEPASRRHGNGGHVPHGGKG
jgi:hypothetical protein